MVELQMVKYNLITKYNTNFNFLYCAKQVTETLWRPQAGLSPRGRFPGHKQVVAGPPALLREANASTRRAHNFASPSR